MYKLRSFIKKMFTPVTVMIVPHAKTKPVSFKIPFSGILLVIFLWLTGSIYIVFTTVKIVEYYSMKSRLDLLENQLASLKKAEEESLAELRSTILSLKRAEEEFKKIFSFKSKRDVLEAFEVSDAGSINRDMEMIKKQIDEAIETVTEIKKYLSEQRDIYRSTPLGWPVKGPITSNYGMRKHPAYKEEAFHTGIDIAVPVGTPVRATADGIVSYAGWAPRSGYTIVIEHGHGFSTVYAHNSKLLVKVGQRVERGSIIAYSGSSGVTTGPHLHYEVWKNGVPVNPITYLKEDY